MIKPASGLGKFWSPIIWLWQKFTRLVPIIYFDWVFWGKNYLIKYRKRYEVENECGAGMYRDGNANRWKH